MSVLVPFAAPVVRGTVLRRYQRFFVDVVLEDGRRTVAHTANTGAMTGLVEEGTPALLTDHAGRGRAYPLELEAVRLPSGWVSVNTGAANAFAAEVIRRGLVPELSGYKEILREVRPHPRSRSRLDLLLSSESGRCFVEVKSVTLRNGDSALFPDAPTERGRRHLEVLARLARRQRAAMLYVARRTDCARFAPARAIDPAYARALERALRAGVTVHCVAADVVDDATGGGLAFAGALPVSLS